MFLFIITVQVAFLALTSNLFAQNNIIEDQEISDYYVLDQENIAVKFIQNLPENDYGILNNMSSRRDEFDDMLHSKKKLLLNKSKENQINQLKPEDENYSDKQFLTDSKTLLELKNLIDQLNEFLYGNDLFLFKPEQICEAKQLDVISLKMEEMNKVLKRYILETENDIINILLYNKALVEYIKLIDDCGQTNQSLLSNTNYLEVLALAYELLASNFFVMREVVLASNSYLIAIEIREYYTKKMNKNSLTYQEALMRINDNYSYLADSYEEIGNAEMYEYYKQKYIKNPEDLESYLESNNLGVNQDQSYLLNNNGAILGSKAEIILIDKITGHSYDYSVNQSGYFDIDKLRIKVLGCIIAQKNFEKEEKILLIEVYDYKNAWVNMSDRSEEDKELLYRGWLLWSDRSMNEFEHYRYNIIFSDCKK